MHEQHHAAAWFGPYPDGQLRAQTVMSLEIAFELAHPALPCDVKQGTAEQSRAGQGRARQGWAGLGRARQGRAGQGRAGQGRAGQGRARAGQSKA